jgi:ABC-2 type transport system ATP-binding protein
MIHVQNLSKSVGDKTILSDLTFCLEAGARLALLGANGSGKTTLLKILATLVSPTSGTVTIAGHNAFASLVAVRPLIGYVPERFEGYPQLSIQEYLEFFADAYKLERSERASAVEGVLELMELGELHALKIQHLSVGEKQRLCLAKTFLHDPQLWLLDNPFSALDIRGQLEMRALIEELGAMGKTVVMATNRSEDVTQSFNRVGILADGGFAFYGDVADIDISIEELFLDLTNPVIVDGEDKE